MIFELSYSSRNHSFLLYYSDLENKSDRKGGIKKLKQLSFGSKSNVDAFRAKLDEGFKTVFLPNGVERIEYKYGNGDSIEFVSPEFCSLTLDPECTA